MSIEQVTHSTTSHAQKRAAGQSVEEAAHEHRLDILRHRAWNQPDEK